MYHPIGIKDIQAQSYMQAGESPVLNWTYSMAPFSTKQICVPSIDSNRYEHFREDLVSQAFK
jgi:hypothetical protein